MAGGTMPSAGCLGVGPGESQTPAVQGEERCHGCSTDDLAWRVCTPPGAHHALPRPLPCPSPFPLLSLPGPTFPPIPSLPSTLTWTGSMPATSTFRTARSRCSTPSLATSHMALQIFSRRARSTRVRKQQQAVAAASWLDG